MQETIKNDLEKANEKLDNCLTAAGNDDNIVQVQLDQRVEELQTELDNRKKKLDDAINQKKECELELHGLKARELLQQPHVNRPIQPPIGNKKVLIDGQLPDVDPQSVHIHDTALIGMRGHVDEFGHPMPILPREHQNKPRARPDYSVNELTPEQVQADMERYEKRRT